MPGAAAGSVGERVDEACDVAVVFLSHRFDTMSLRAESLFEVLHVDVKSTFANLCTSYVDPPPPAPPPQHTLSSRPSCLCSHPSTYPC